MFFTGDYAGDCAHSEMRYNMNDLNLTDKVINSMIEYNRGDARRIPVSYTHLTLPTILLV